MLRAQSGGREVRILREVRPPREFCEHSPMTIQKGASNYSSVAALIYVCRNRKAEFITPSRHRNAHRAQGRIAVGLEQNRIEERNIDVLTLAGLVAMAQCRDRADSPMESSEIVA